MTECSSKITAIHDVFIVGGGPIGATLGYALAKGGLTVAILDAADPKLMFDPRRDGRTSALSHGSRNILEGLNLWQHFQMHAEPILDIRISDKDSRWRLDYHHDIVGPDPMGYIIENTVLRRILYEQARTLPNLTWYAPDKLLALERTRRHVTAQLESGVHLTAKLCIGADGRHSQIRDIAQIPVSRWSYGQTALVCVVEHEKPHHGMAFEHFMPSGPLAFLPMQGNRSSVVWSEQSEDIPLRMQLSDNDFSLLLQRKFGDVLGSIHLVSQRWTYPLEAIMAHRYWDQRLALAGDAAHVIHPIAGQGLNLGLRDVAALVEGLIDATRVGLDIGSDTVLKQYQQWRHRDVLSLMAVTDGLNRLFSTSLPPIRWLRAAGLGTIQRLPFAKRILMRRAMGIAGRLPRLVEGKAL